MEKMQKVNGAQTTQEIEKRAARYLVAFAKSVGMKGLTSEEARKGLEGKHFLDGFSKPIQKRMAYCRIVGQAKRGFEEIGSIVSGDDGKLYHSVFRDKVVTSLPPEKPQTQPVIHSITFGGNGVTVILESGLTIKNVSRIEYGSQS